MELEEKTLLILKSQVQSLGSTEAFLTNRGWKIKSTPQLKEALLHLLRNRPAFFLVSIEHNHPKVRKLPRIISQLLATPVIGFSESGSMDSLIKLQSMETENSIHSQVTGPAVERAINKYLKELKDNEHQTNMWKSTAASQTGGGMVSIKGEEQNQSPLNYLLSELFGHEATFPPSDPASNKHLSMQDSLISLCTKEALEKFCPLADPDDTQESSPADQVACLQVESARFSGYLLIAAPAQAPRHLINQIKDQLLLILRENGEPLKDSPLQDLELMPVNFPKWATKTADFLHLGKYENYEIATAFFLRPDVKAPIAKEEKNMLAIDLPEVEAETSIGFNLYLWLEKNKRFLHYIKKGHFLSSNQKDRLVQQGLDCFHILKPELPDFSLYRAERFLNQKIMTYRMKDDSSQKQPRATVD